MEPSLLSIRSTSSQRELIFSYHKDEYFRVELKGFEVTVATEVWVYTDANQISCFFQELAGFNKPWHGQRLWASIEQDFSLSATCTSLGSVTFHVGMRGPQGAPEEWRVEAGLVTEFGQLEQIAKNAEVFFNASGT